MLEIIHHVLPEAFFDVLKTVPLLLIVYALLYYIENRLTNTRSCSHVRRSSVRWSARSPALSPVRIFPQQRPALSRQAFLAPGKRWLPFPCHLG